MRRYCLNAGPAPHDLKPVTGERSGVDRRAALHDHRQLPVANGGEGLASGACWVDSLLRFA